jgi:hypothetical protein
LAFQCAKPCAPLAGNHGIRRVDAKTRIITTLAGNGTAGFSGCGTAGTSAMLNSPSKLVAAAGKLLFRDFGNNLVLMVVLGDISPAPAPPALPPPPFSSSVE